MSLRRLRCAVAGITPFIAVLALSAITQACVTAAKPRKAAQDFTLRDSNGASVKLSDYKGKVVLLDFWATWCEGCKIEIPWYMEFEDRYKKSGFAAIGVSMDSDWKAVKPFLAEKKMNYPVVPGSDGLLNLYGVRALPATFLIDRDGRIADSHFGMVNEDAFESEIRVLLHGNIQTAVE
jgi:peroxiredoxin